MSIPTIRRACFRSRMLPILAAAGVMLTPQMAYAAASDSGANVECLLPGQIHSVGGHATMGARRPIQTTPADCRERGGEYTVDDHASQQQEAVQAPVISSDDGRIIACLLPRQLRQLGERTRYATRRHTIHTTRSNCQTRGGDVIAPAHIRHAGSKR